MNRVEGLEDVEREGEGRWGWEKCLPRPEEAQASVARHTETVNFVLRPPVPCCPSQMAYLPCTFDVFYLDRRGFFFFFFSLSQFNFCFGKFSFTFIITI